MDFKTRFNEGDRVHFLHNAKAVSSIVRGFIIEQRPKAPLVITYLCHENPDEVKVSLKIRDSIAFGTKEELLSSL